MFRHRALPISLYLHKRRAVIVGDGPAAARRGDQIEAAGADLARVSWAAFTPEIVQNATLVAFQPEHGADTADLPLADMVETARAAGALVYVADNRALSDFAMPGIAARGPVKLAASSDGVAPALTRRLKDELQRLLDEAGPALDALVESLAEARASLDRDGRATELFRRASRARIDGRLAIDPDEPDPPE